MTCFCYILYFNILSPFFSAVYIYVSSSFHYQVFIFFILYSFFFVCGMWFLSHTIHLFRFFLVFSMSENRLKTQILHSIINDVFSFFLIIILGGCKCTDRSHSLHYERATGLSDILVDFQYNGRQFVCGKVLSLR